MATGMRIRAQDGTLLVDSTARVARLLGTLSIGGAGTAQSGSITDARFADGVPDYFLLGSVAPDFDGLFPTIAINGNVLSWSYSAAGNAAYQRPAATILYMVY